MIPPNIHTLPNRANDMLTFIKIALKKDDHELCTHKKEMALTLLKSKNLGRCLIRFRFLMPNTFRIRIS
ncbi:unnamed protein product [Meloidogyne enterolobii]|uniref:Uncharacterized protein n=1 Tax=Meloidogyne enterolobii TaxID=390850 RepID=A0ACB0YVC3_MELEN